MATHKKKDKSWIDDRAARTYEEWSKAWKEKEVVQDTDDSDTQSVMVTQDQLWVSANATKKGTIYGLGAEGGKYKGATSSYSSSAMENQALRVEVEALKKVNLEREEEMRLVRKRLDDLEKRKMKKKKKKSSYHHGTNSKAM